MTDDSRSQIMHLLEQQKYDDALPILDELMDRIPSDRETRMYHLLVARILILRWNLSRAATEQESYSPTRNHQKVRLSSTRAQKHETSPIVWPDASGSRGNVGRPEHETPCYCGSRVCISYHAGVSYAGREQCSDPSAIEDGNLHGLSLGREGV